MKNKNLFILIGPKGSGKTFIGQLVEKHFAIPFLRVEAIALQVKKERAIADQSYIEEVFAAIEKEVRLQLSLHDSLIFESTGLTNSFDNMLNSLSRDFRVYLIGISTDLDTCLHRVKTRDASMHIDVSDTLVNQINAAVMSKKLVFDKLIKNTDATTEELIEKFDSLFRKIRYQQRSFK